MFYSDVLTISMQKLKPIGLVEKHINKKRYHLIAPLLYEYVAKRRMMMMMWRNGVFWTGFIDVAREAMSNSPLV